MGRMLPDDIVPKARELSRNTNMNAQTPGCNESTTMRLSLASLNKKPQPETSSTSANGWAPPILGSLTNLAWRILKISLSLFQFRCENLQTKTWNESPYYSSRLHPRRPQTTACYQTESQNRNPPSNPTAESCSIWRQVHSIVKFSSS